MSDNATQKPRLRKSEPSYTLVRKVLVAAQFNPKEAGALRMIADMRNPQYFSLRAIEEIQGAETLRQTRQPQNVKAYQEKMQMALRLLALAMVEELIA
jgi:hypothetical protein